MNPNNKIHIQPSNIVQVDNFSIDSIVVLPFQNSARINVYLYCLNEFVCAKTLIISGDDYVNWQSDNPYLLNYVCQKLNFTRL